MPFYPRKQDQDAILWRNAVFAAGGSVGGGQFNSVQTLIRSLKVSGAWFVPDRLFPFAAENPTQSLCCLKSRQFATTVGTVGTNIIFTAGRGWKGDGVSGYINSGFNPTTATSPNYTQNSASLGVWVETAGAAGSRYGGNTITTIQLGGSNIFAAANQSGNFNTGLGLAPTGLLSVSRTGAAAQAFYQNGVSVAVDANASTTVGSETLLFLAATVSESPAGFCNGRLSLGVIGSGFTPAQWAEFYAPTRVYLTTQGVS